MTEENQAQIPKIEFPCTYPIKIFVQTVDNILNQIEDIFTRCGANIITINQNSSSKGNYLAFTITIMAKSEDELSHIFEQLKTLPALRMVL